MYATIRRFALPFCFFLLLIAPALSRAAEDGPKNPVLEEIIVTATKRTESLEDVPISISVVSGDTIEKYEIVDL